MWQIVVALVVSIILLLPISFFIFFINKMIKNRQEKIKE